ncbi:MAG: hypothetical protein SFY56_13735 [Bacteroidota bacterium]|nr:hypothetical protein [Bacteroidota bacterium]
MVSDKDEEWEKLYVFAKQLADTNKSFEDIENQLKQKTKDEATIIDIIKRLKKVRHAIKTKSGLTKLGIGALFLVVGFLITCINFHNNQSFTFVMYGFTSIGLVLMLWGLYEIIG